MEAGEFIALIGAAARDIRDAALLPGAGHRA